MTIGKYGPAVLGDDRYEKEQEQIDREGGPLAKFGRAVREDWDQDPDVVSIHGYDPEETPEERAERTKPARELTEDDLPPGYSIEGGKGGYYVLRDPDDNRIDGPTASGKYGPGAHLAVLAAIEHCERQIRQQETDEKAGDDEQLSVTELEAVLRKNPSQANPLMQAEFARAEGPRPAAIEQLLLAEQRREAPREEVVATLEAVRADLGPEEVEVGAEQ